MKRSFLNLVLLFTALLFFCPSFSHTATKKALLVGINRYENLPFYSNLLRRWVTNLKGSLNDVNSMKGLLISRYGFRVEDIKVLIDNEATRNSILNDFESWLINGTKEGDLAFFYFSGHGTQIPDQNGDEEDGMDEALCPYDLVPVGAGNVAEARAILDDEIGVLLRRLKGRAVVVFVDACNSGSMTRSIGSTPVSQLEETPAYYPKFIPVELPQSRLRGKSFTLDFPRQDDIPRDQIFISSSKENQVSLEIALDEGFRGAMTSAMVEGMARKTDMTYIELYEYARKVIKDRHRLEQDAQIEPKSGKILENRVFVSRHEIPLKMRPETPPVGKTSPGPRPVPQVNKPQAANVKVMPSPYPTAPEKPEPTSEAVAPIPKPPLLADTSLFPPEKPSIALQPLPMLKGKRVLLRVEPLRGASPHLMKEVEDRIKRVEYAEMIESGLFDRLIRGEVREGKLHVRLLNRTGDVEVIRPTSNMEELTSLIRTRLGYAYIVKQLAHISSPAPPFRVKVWVTDDRRRDFRIGEKVMFNFYSEKDCYLYLINVDSQGDFQIIFPNRLHRDNFVRAGVERKIPDETMSEKFDLVFREPAGEEMIKAIATFEPLMFEELKIEGKKETFDESEGISVSAGLSPIFLKKIEEILASREFIWSEDTVVIRTHPPH